MSLFSQYRIINTEGQKDIATRDLHGITAGVAVGFPRESRGNGEQVLTFTVVAAVMETAV